MVLYKILYLGFFYLLTFKIGITMNVYMTTVEDETLKEI